MTPNEREALAREVALCPFCGTQPTVIDGQSDALRDLVATLTRERDEALQRSATWQNNFEDADKARTDLRARLDRVRGVLADTSENEDAVARVLCDIPNAEQAGAWMAWRVDAGRVLDHLRAMATGADTPVVPQEGTQGRGEAYRFISDVGAGAERTATVRWLREWSRKAAEQWGHAKIAGDTLTAEVFEGQSKALSQAADRIERGDHTSTHQGGR